MADLLSWFASLDQSPIAILIGAAFATFGWIATAWQARRLSRKQHTLTILLNDGTFRNAVPSIRRFVRMDAVPPAHSPEYRLWREHLRDCLNHYEFVAAAARRKDVDQMLVRLSERGVIIRLFRYAEPLIDSMRKASGNPKIYENLEWLVIRFERPLVRERLAKGWWILGLFFYI